MDGQLDNAKAKSLAETAKALLAQKKDSQLIQSFQARLTMVDRELERLHRTIQVKIECRDSHYDDDKAMKELQKIQLQLLADYDAAMKNEEATKGSQLQGEDEIPF